MTQTELSREPEAGPRVFIVVPTYNRWDEARVSLRCLLQNSYKNIKILLVEDSCKDGTVEKCRAEFPQVEILHGDGQLWWSGAINMGTQHAVEQGAELVMWINDDIRVEPDTVRLLVETVERNGPKSIACARIRLTDSSAPEWSGGAPPWHPEFKKRLDELPAHGDVPIEHPPGGQGVVLSTQCFRELGGIDARNFPHYWADHDFHYRAMRAGYKYFITADALVWNVPNHPRPEVKSDFSLRWLRWFLTDRRSAMNMPTLRRLLKRHLSPREYRKTFYPILVRHLSWLSYEWLIRKPLLHKPLRALKRGLSRAEPHNSATR